MKIKEPLESEEQKGLVKYLKLKNIKHYAPMNENIFSGIIRAIIKNQSLASRIICSIENKLKSMGKSKGICDIVIPYPSINKHGLYIELKRVSGGTVSKEQKEWIEFLKDQNYKVEVCKGCQEAIKVINKYFERVKK